MDIDITGKAIVATGAARGIGRALALGLAGHGARVAVAARDRRRAQVVVEEIAQLPGSPAALAVEADVSDEDAVATAAAQVDAAWGRVDALINNARWMPGFNPILEMDAAVLDRSLKSNLVSGFWTTKRAHCLPVQRHRRTLARHGDHGASARPRLI
jgi:NAD(P)-dependent dehydrogenase (short-subunit alcohol dehydrogenase family)